MAACLVEQGVSLDATDHVSGVWSNWFRHTAAPSQYPFIMIPSHPLQHGVTALLMAVNNGNTEMAAWLVERGAWLDARDNVSEWGSR